LTTRRDRKRAFRYSARKSCIVDETSADDGVRIGEIFRSLRQSDDFERTERSRILAECQFDLNRSWPARHDVFLTVNDLEVVGGNDFETPMRGLDRIGRDETRALSKREGALPKPND